MATIIEIYDANGTLISTTEDSGGGGDGTGDVVGPSSATDNAIARYDSTTGKLIQNSTATVSDAGVVGAAGALLSGLTASRMVVTDGSKNLASNSVTATEAGYLSGVTSAIQTQLNAKQAVVSGVDDTEIGYLNGVTSAIQTQLDAKLAKAGGTMTGDLVLAGDPDSALKAATKQYVDSVAQGLDIKPSVLCATTANITLSGEQTLDGVLTSTSRVLVKNQSAPAENGIYVSAAGAWARATDMDAWSEVPGAFCFVEQGAANGDCGFVCSSNSGGTLNTTDITFSQFSGVGTFQPLDSTLTALAAYNTNGMLAQTTADTFTGRTITGTSNEISVSNGDGVSGNPTLSLPSTIDLGGKTSFEIPNGTNPTVDAAGEIAIDTDADGNLIDQGLIVYHDGVQKMYAVAVDTLPSTDDHVLAYDATADKFVFQAQAGGSSTSTPTASTASAWDSNVNFSADNFLAGYATTAASGGTLTLTVDSKQIQHITGTGSHTVQLPDVSTLALGHSFIILSSNTGAVTVRSSDSSSIRIQSTVSFQIYTSISTSDNTAAGWKESNFAIAPTTAGSASNIVTFGNNNKLADSGVLISTNPTSSGVARWTTDLNLNAANFVPRYTTTATAAGTTTLTVASNHFQFFTGSTTQNCKMPVTSTLTTGFNWEIVNDSSGAVTIQSSGSNTIATANAGTVWRVICILTTGTDAASWKAYQVA